MVLDDFLSAVSGARLPAGASAELQALWHDAHGGWDRAHELVQDGNTRGECLVHAYLHRKEGDLPNARYWYRRAGIDTSNLPLDEEWREIARQLCKRGNGSDHGG